MAAVSCVQQPRKLKRTAYATLEASAAVRMQGVHVSGQERIAAGAAKDIP